MATHEDVDPHQLGPVVMDFYATSLERGLLARDALDPARFIDVTHDDFVNDNMAAAHRIYDHFGHPLEGEALDAMQARAKSHTQGQHGSHDYGLGEFGLTDDQVKTRFEPYVERFGLDWE